MAGSGKKPDLDRVFASPEARGYIDSVAEVPMDGESKRKEILELHRSRMAPKLIRRIKSVGPEQLRTAAAKEVNVRALVVELWATMDSLIDSAEFLRDDAVVRMMSKYPHLVPIKNVTDQRLFLRSGLDIRVTWLRPVIKARDTAKYVMDDIDRASWQLRLIHNTFEQATRPDMEF